MNDAGTMTIKTARDGRICVLTLGGDLDFLAAAEFLEQVARVVDARTERRAAKTRASGQDHTTLLNTRENK